MGKKTGFMEYDRSENRELPIVQRIQNYKEFHVAVPKAVRQAQGARCMDCGVPFCQSGMLLQGMVTGCPLHNLIPEWNDMVYQDHMDMAYERLAKTNNFPEFTSRVCPAPCEKACTCSLHGEAVTIRDNEYAIMETAYAKGYVKPRKSVTRTGKKVAIIGSGPSGLALADQLNKRGHLVTVYEAADRPGGLMMYGIPNMKLEKNIIDRRIELMKEEGITFQMNTRISSKQQSRELQETYDAIALACGSRKPRDIQTKGRTAKGICYALDYLTQTTQALLEHELPILSAKGKHVIVIGGGDTGNDCCGTAVRQGALSVTQLEMMPKPPIERPSGNEWPQWPRVLKTDYGQAECQAVYGNDPRLFQTTVKEFLMDAEGNLTGVKTIRLEPVFHKETKRTSMEEVPGSETVLPADMVLIAAGFIGCEEDTAAAFQITVDHGRVRTLGFQTTQPKVFALGDMRRGQSLVVWAIAEGRECAREIDAYLMGYTNL